MALVTRQSTNALMRAVNAQRPMISNANGMRRNEETAQAGLHSCTPDLAAYYPTVSNGNATLIIPITPDVAAAFLTWLLAYASHTNATRSIDPGSNARRM